MARPNIIEMWLQKTVSIVRFSMAAEGEFSFVIAVFAVSNELITIELYASLVLGILFSTILAPLLLRLTVWYFNRKAINTKISEDIAPEHGLVEKDPQRSVFFCIQTRSQPAWGIQSNMVLALNELSLDVIDHRSWSPPGQISSLLLNEVYVKDSHLVEGNMDFDTVAERIDSIQCCLETVINQPDAVVRVQKWVPALANGELVSPELAILDQIKSTSMRPPNSLEMDVGITDDESPMKNSSMELHDHVIVVF